MSKHVRVEQLLRDAGVGKSSWPEHYVAYFVCFNRGLYYEAHDVLEALWLPDRSGPYGQFYKALIQLAGAFVHVQKQRRDPAVRLLDLAAANFESYPDVVQGLDLAALSERMAAWRKALVRGDDLRSLLEPAPRLQLAG